MSEPKPKTKRTPRPAWTYRGARRYAARKTGAVMLRHAPEPIDGSAPAPELNRSQHLVRAKSYAYAREISPSTEPVR